MLVPNGGPSLTLSVDPSDKITIDEYRSDIALDYNEQYP